LSVRAGSGKTVGRAFGGFGDVDQAAEIDGARMRLKMSQEMLALAAGVSVRTVIRAGQGTRVSGESLRAICAVLGLDSAALATPAVPVSTGRDEGVLPGTGDPIGGVYVAPVGTQPFLRRVLGFRRTPMRVVFGIVFSVSAAVSAAGMAYGVEKSVKAARWSGEHVFAAGVSRYVNALADGRDNGGALPAYEAMGCPNWETFGSILGSFLRGQVECERTFRTVRLERTVAADGSTLLAVGPVTAEFGHDVARRLSGNPGVSWSVAYGTGRQGRDLAWFDPRRVPREEFPLPPGGNGAWVFVRLSKQLDGRS
jgi:DNA-binding XRE family transcriptional regulator